MASTKLLTTNLMSKCNFKSTFSRIFDTCSYDARDGLMTRVYRAKIPSHMYIVQLRGLPVLRHLHEGSECKLFDITHPEARMNLADVKHVMMHTIIICS